MAYKVGSTVIIAVNFDDKTRTPPEPADPTTVTFVVRGPDRTVTTYTYPTSPELTKLDVGRYQFKFARFTVPGRYEYGGEGVGGIDAANDGSFYVDPFLP